MGALFITNPRRKNPMATRRRNGLALRSNGALNKIIAKKIGVKISTKGGREAVKQYKLTAAYKKWKKTKAYTAALSKGRAAAKSTSAANAAYKAKTGKSRAQEYFESLTTTGKKKKKATRKKAKRTTRVAAVAKLKKGVKVITAKNGRKMYYKGGKLISAKAAGSKSNPSRRRNPSRKSAFGGIALRTNSAMSTGIMPVDMVAGAIDKVPVIGPIAAPYVAPVAIGAAGGASTFLLNRYFEDKLPAQLQPYSYGLFGVAGALALTLVPIKKYAQQRRMLAAGMATVGAGIEMYRHLFAKEEMAAVGVAASEPDLAGLAMMNNPYGAVQFTGNPSYGEIAYGQDEGLEEYNDTMETDSAVSGNDFDETEGRALLQGPRSWWKMFGRPGKRMYNRNRGSHSRHAGRQGHRWGWLIKLVGFSGAKQIAAMAPQARLRVIQQMKAQAQATLAKAAQTQQSQLSDMSEMSYQGVGGAGSFGSYGALMYAGQSF
jgi:hypothetical protein